MRLSRLEFLLLLANLPLLVHNCFHKSRKPAKKNSGNNWQPSNSSMESNEDICSPCKNDGGFVCHNGGKCCVTESDNVYCECLPNYYGRSCEQFSLESSGTKTLTLLSSVLGLLITIFVFIILILLVLHTYKTNKRRKLAQRQRAQMLESKMKLIQEDMDKMSQTEKMTRLTRLSKLIEATTRAALVAYPGPYVTPPSPFPKKQGLPSISEKPAANFRRFSEPTILTLKPPPSPFKTIRKESTRNQYYHEEDPMTTEFYSI